MVAAADEMTTPNGTPQPANGRPRTVVAGHYAVDLDALLGSGGMALVYHGRDLRTRRDVALKTLRLEYRNDPDTRARFRREARTMAFLAHPNVVRVYDLYEDAEAPWAVLEYVPGRSLKELVREHGPFSLEETARILGQIADALDHLHRRGYVHLDVKPQNLILTPDGTVKLIDFGLAQRAGEMQELIGGTTFGTAAYLAPEQACGEPVDASTDVYALGCVVYELLTGRPPFEPGSGHEVKNDVIRAHLEQDPKPLTAVRPDLSLPAWVDDVVLWALAKRPEERYRDVASFAQVFRSGLDGTIGETQATTAAFDPIPAAGAATIAPTTKRTIPSLSIGRRMAAALYRAGGRTARRSTGLGKRLWRVTAAFAIANMLLALVLFIDQGSLPDFGGGSSLHAGGEARVVTDGLRIRAEPGLSAAALTLVDTGDQLDVVGDSTVADDSTWWPVTFTQDGARYEGYVWSGGIEPESNTGIRGRVDDLVDRVKSTPDRLLERVGL